jgi:formylglycine-generating enzyme required for sulfatase activity
MLDTEMGMPSRLAALGIRFPRLPEEGRARRALVAALTLGAMCGQMAGVQPAAADGPPAVLDALQELGVTVAHDPRGWMKVALPAEDPQVVLRRALPHLYTLCKQAHGNGVALDLAGSELTDAHLAILANADNVRALDISHNPAVTTLAPLRRLRELESLSAAGTSVADLAPIAGLTQLQQLDVSGTRVADVAPLAGLIRLRELDLSRTRVTDLSALAELTQLQLLALDGLGAVPFNADGRIRDLRTLRDPRPTDITALVPGDAFRDCSACPQMVVVPAGGYEMGSLPGEDGRDDDEGPRHRVTIARQFAVSKYETRFDEWLLCVQDGACTVRPDAGFGRGAHPVINVSWDDAKRYVAWLAERSGEAYRLLTEAEWEYIARASSQASRFWGADERQACAFANVYDADGKAAYEFPWASFACDDGYFATAPVGMFEPNAFGLHDTLGNVWEWTEDCYWGTYADAPADGSAWVTEGCASRVFRGGSWSFLPQHVRSADRDSVAPAFRGAGLGLRVARSLGAP